MVRQFGSIGLFFLALGLLGFALDTQFASAQDSGTGASDKVAAVAKRLNNRQKYVLKYKMKAGEEIRWAVEHVVSTKVQMAGESEESSSRSVTNKLWKVTNVDQLGNLTFVHSIESIDMWQKVGEGKPVTYNSLKDKEVPEEYQGVAEQLGKPVAMFSIKPDGSVIDRKSSLSESSFGVGKITIPLPNQAIPVGHKWSVPTQLKANDENGAAKVLKARVLYELTEVRGQNASIRFKTEVLTPITSEKVRSTIMQQMTEGYLVFDMELGRPVVKRVDWDEKAQGFEGPDSLLTYVGKMTEKLVTDKESSTQSNNANDDGDAKKVPNEAARLKTKDDGPLIRK